MTGCTNYLRGTMVSDGIISDPDEYISSPYELAGVEQKACFESNERRNIAIFFDGTENHEGSDTNVFRMRNVLTAQPAVNGCPRNYVLYVKGVGTEGWWLRRKIGAGIGRGNEEDVRQAYAYIANLYRGPQDRLYIVGFSRGASSARILTSMLHLAGLPTNLKDRQDNRLKFAKDLFETYSSDLDTNAKRKMLARMIGEDHQVMPTVTFLGLYDTVHALGITHSGEHKSQLKENFSESICNVAHVSQALSIDDNRSEIFTPALIHKGLLADCDDREFHGFVEQVWFAGAHSDVGGGYRDSDLSAVTLNWMMDRLLYAEKKADCSQPSETGTVVASWEPVYQDPLGLSHDAESDMRFVHNYNRDWPNFLKPPADDSGKTKEKGLDAGVRAPILHETAKERITSMPLRRRDFNWTADPQLAWNYPWIYGRTKRVRNYPGCFIKDTAINTKPIVERGLETKFFWEYQLKWEKDVKKFQPGDICPTVWKAPALNCAGDQSDPEA